MNEHKPQAYGNGHLAVQPSPLTPSTLATLATPADPVAGLLLQALTTEHFTLQTARSATISDTHGRSSLYLSTVSSAVVALAFIAQVSRVGQPFFLFALAILPVLFLLGILTFLRLVDSSIEDAFLARAINRIRHRYTELDPASRSYFLLSGNDDLDGVMRNAGLSPSSRWHLLSHTASMVAVVTSMIGGVFVVLVVDVAWNLPLSHSVALGAAVALASAAVLMAHQSRRWRRAESAVAPLFPSPPPVRAGATAARGPA